MDYPFFKTSCVKAAIKKLSLCAGLLFVYAPGFSEPLEKLADKLQQGIADYPNIKLAVLEFPYINRKESDGPIVVQERLTTLFAKNRKITLIERNLLRKVAGELKLQASGVTDEKSTRKMGQLLGAEAVLTGTLNDVSDSEVEVNARVLIVETAKIVSAEKITVKRTWKNTPTPRKATAGNVEALLSRLDEGEKYTFRTVTFKSGRVQRTYFKDKTAIAVDVASKDGKPLKSPGKLPDGFYTEYYANGTLKTEKILINSKEYGVYKTYFPGGTLQNEAYYNAGKLDGPVKIYNETGSLLLEQNFKNGIPNGYFKEYNCNGTVKSETFYKDGHVAPAPAEAVARIIEVKSWKLARGEKFKFYEDKKYLCQITIDDKFNILFQQGQYPDGIARTYSKEGKPEKEFIFTDNKLAILKILDQDGNILSEKDYILKD